MKFFFKQYIVRCVYAKMSSIRKIRNSKFTKWMVAIVLFLFLEAGTVELIINGTADISIEFSESSAEKNFDNFEKDIEKDIEKEKFSSDPSFSSDIEKIFKFLTAKGLKTNSGFGEVISPPPESFIC